MSQQQFLTEVSELEKSITEAKANIGQIQEFHTQLLGATSGSGSQLITEQREVKVTETKKILFNIKDRLKKIERENLKAKDDSNLRRQRHAFLKEKFTNLLEEYQKVEDEYMRKHKDRLARQYHVVYPGATQTDIDAYLEGSTSTPVFQQAILRSEARDALAEVQKRHEDIKQIEQTIAELAALFQEVQLQVEEQDEALVDIGENVDETSAEVGASVNYLKQATDSAAAARNKKWILFGIIISILALIIVIALLKLGKSHNTS